jgi:hypothetical protein
MSTSSALESLAHSTPLPTSRRTTWATQAVSFVVSDLLAFAAAAAGAAGPTGAGRGLSGMVELRRGRAYAAGVNAGSGHA